MLKKQGNQVLGLEEGDQVFGSSSGHVEQAGAK